MKLPNPEKAVIAIEKLTEYCLSADHPRGKHKARLFSSVCGITAENANLLLRALIDAATQGDAVLQLSDHYGRRFTIEWRVHGPTGSAEIVTAWIVRHDEDFPRFVSAYVR